VPLASEDNAIALSLTGANESDDAGTTVRVHLTDTPPAWLRFTQDTVAVKTGKQARFRFDVAKQTSVGRETALVFAVTDARSGALLAEKTVRLEVAAPQQFALLGNYPNPFREQTQVGYRLPTAAVVTVEVYDALGRQVERLDEDAKKAGSHTAHIDASDLSSGVYFYRVEIETEGGEKHRKSGKMVLVR
jgi:hypothetical protein